MAGLSGKVGAQALMSLLLLCIMGVPKSSLCEPQFFMSFFAILEGWPLTKPSIRTVCQFHRVVGRAHNRFNAPAEAYLSACADEETTGSQSKTP
ncbi:hypothetical protein BC830DRAFT_1146319 [Chytriomyces sp. MP71]|nr:hypothetical protein BC830DRAFT_1146319 [Chytriomyces sp. MP71]